MSGTNGSFYTNGLPISSAETGLGNVPASPLKANPASSSFYLSGSIYQTVQNQDQLLALLTADTALVVADLVASNVAATNAAASAAAAATSLATLTTTALLKANNLSDLASVATAKVNLALDQVTNTSDVNKPVSTAQATADALVASNAAAAITALSGTTTTSLALKAPLASPALTGVPVAPTAAALNNSTQLATTAYADAATATLSGTVTTALALKAPLASPSLTGVPVAPTAAPGTATTQLATTAFVDAARVILVAVDALKAPLASPALTGVPVAPTAAALNNTTQLATTAYSDAAVAVEKARAQAAEALLAPLASAALTGAPTAPTATVGTNTTQLATTAFVLANATSVSPATVAPLIDGTAAVGSSPLYARQDHVHPTDTSRAALASPTFTGVPAAPTATVGTNTTQLATTAFVIANAASAGVSTIAGNAGAFTLGAGLTNAVNVLKINAGHVPGEPSTGSAAAGEAGEIIKGSLPSGSALTYVSGTAVNIASVSLTAGDWDVDGVAYYSTGGSATVSVSTSSISTTSATQAGADSGAQVYGLALAINNNWSATIPTSRLSLSTTTPVYLVAQATLSGTVAGWGTIRARRVR